MTRTIAFGDVHGCSKALRALIDIIQPKADDRLIFLGDYVDRGPDSPGVVQILMELDQQCNLICLRGNHEVMLLNCARNGLDPSLWYLMGGKATVTSYGGLLTSIPERHIDFLYGCRPYFETEQHIFVHANYQHHLPMGEQPEASLYWEHLSDRFPLPHCSGKRVFLGHSPQGSGKVATWDHLVCLDTYCFGGGWLTAMEVNSGETWQANRFGHLRREMRPLVILWNFMRRVLANRQPNPRPESANPSQPDESARIIR